MATLAEQIEASRTESAATAHAFKRVLVHVDCGAWSDRRIEVAVDLARRVAGKVTGVYVARPVLPPVFMVGALPPAVLADQEKLDFDDAAAARRRFLDHVVRRGLESEWRFVRDASVSAMRRLSRYADIVVVGQADPASPDAPLAARAEEVALGSGRPVLVVPYIGAAPGLGKRIVIAWDGSREAARAVADALPLMRQASSVWVVSIDAEAGCAGDGVKPAEDLCRFLHDHGIQARPDHLRTDDCSEADVLLSRIADFGADLLVMGCYGHTRVRELVLGGMTREILRHMTVPVLLSH
jgi:nucleotide-binding universal stress UspA family protein